MKNLILIILILAYITSYSQDNKPRYQQLKPIEITSLSATGAINGYVATANGYGGIELRSPVDNVTTFIKEKSPVGIFTKAHSSIILNDQIFLGERGKDPRIFKFSNINNLSIYSSTGTISTGLSYGGLESGVYVSSINKIVFFSINSTDFQSLDVIEVNPNTLAYTIHTFTSIQGTYWVGNTDGTYLYVSTTNTFAKIRVSDWTVVYNRGSMISNLYIPHSMQVNSSRNQIYLAGTDLNSVGKFYIVSMLDFSFTELNLSQYLIDITDDICYYDDGNVCKVFIAGESNVPGYGGAMVDITNSNLITGIYLHPSYGLFIKGTKIYSCAFDGYIQTFSALDIKNISTFTAKGIVPNEIMFSSTDRSFLTNWDNSISYLAEFFVPTPLPEISSMNNPMTTTGDIIYSSSGSTPSRLGIGSPNQILTVVSGVPSWQSASTGFTDPMTTRGDIIYRNSSNITSRLGLGGLGQFLQSNGTDLVWGSAPSGSSQWTNDTNGINYGNNVGIGATSSGINKLFVTSNFAGSYSTYITNTNQSSGQGLNVSTSALTTDETNPIFSATNSIIKDVFRIYPTGTIRLSTQSVSAGIPSSGFGHLYIKTDGKIYYKNESGTEYDLTLGSGGGSGVTSFGSNNLNPLFTTSVANPTTTPVLNFSAISQAENTIYAAPNGSSGIPSFRKIVIRDISASGTPTNNTYLRGDGTWSTIPTPPSGFTDPMTTRGDIIYRNQFNITDRLGLGANGKVLQSNGTDLVWGDVGANYWTYSSPNLYPNNTTDNVLIGTTTNPSNYYKFYVQGISSFNYSNGGTGGAASFYSNGASVIYARNTSSNGYGIISWGNNSEGIFSGADYSSTNDVKNALTVARGSNLNTPSNGIGTSIAFKTNNSQSGNNYSLYGEFGIKSTNITLGSESGDFIWNLTTSGSLSEKMRLSSAGTSTIGAVLKLTPSDSAPLSPSLGMIYVNTDTHIYFYNGSTWKQLDN